MLCTLSLPAESHENTSQRKMKALRWNTFPICLPIRVWAAGERSCLHIYLWHWLIVREEPTSNFILSRRCWRDRKDCIKYNAMYFECNLRCKSNIPWKFCILGFTPDNEDSVLLIYQCTKGKIQHSCFRCGYFSFYESWMLIFR